MSTKLKPFFECEYCFKKLISEKNLTKHSCARKKRFEQCTKAIGMLAFEDYKYWLTFKKRAVVDLHTFIDSTFFTAFISFQELVNKRGIPNKRVFIKAMAERSISPHLWGADEMYEVFIAEYDKCPPNEHITATLRTLSDISLMFDCDISESLLQLLPSEIGLLIFQRKLSPWILLLSPKFMKILQGLTDQSQYIMITTILKPQEWRATFNKNPTIVADVKKIVKEFEL